MPAGMEHFVLHATDTMGTGIHRHSVTEITPAIEMILHHALSEGWATNADHELPAWMLVRILTFQASRITKGALLKKEDQDHVVDLSTADGLHSLVMLIAYVALYPAVHGRVPTTSKSDAGIDFGKTPMLEEEFLHDLEVAWHMTSELMTFLNE